MSSTFWIIAAMAVLLAVFYDFLFRVLKLYYENENHRILMSYYYEEEPGVTTIVENVDNRIKRQVLLQPEPSNVGTYNRTNRQEDTDGSSILLGEKFWYFK